MAGVSRFEDLKAWQLARALSHSVHLLIARPGMAKQFALRDQLSRAALSAMTNIAEGFARKSDKEFAYFLRVSKASAVEIQSLLYVVHDTGHLDSKEFSRIYKQADEVAGVTLRLAQSLDAASGSSLSGKSSVRARTQDSGHRTAVAGPLGQHHTEGQH
ncbi:four helix bundle protein [bacterium]|nr:four helix bundle protein [bacterium]